MEYAQIVESNPFMRVRRFLNEFGIENLAQELGEREIQARDFFVNVFEYTTAEPKERIWEAHRLYIDVHLVLRGVEELRYSHVSNCQVGEYELERDFIPIIPPPLSQQHSLILHAQQELVVFYPQDAHQSGVIHTSSQTIRKAVFKIKVDTAEF